MRAFAGVSLFVLMVGCTESETSLSDGGAGDAQQVQDAGRDASDPGDTGATDSGADDAAADSGVVDTGVDAGPGDIGGVDAGIDCTALDQTSCEAQVGCMTAFCPGYCSDPGYVGCFGPNDPIPGCPMPQPCPCDTLDEMACAAAPECHRVFTDPQDCPCDGLGCCARFSACGYNALADCTGANLSCREMEPYCEGPYVVAYVDTCYEGCVLSEDCMP